MPDLVVSAACDYLLCSDADLQGEPRHLSSLDLGPIFGLKQGRHLDFFPARTDVAVAATDERTPPVQAEIHP
jgi:hypothetical protein